MNGIIETVKNALFMLFGSEKLAVIFLSAVPIVETRGAVPIAIGYGLNWHEAWLYSFLGSAAVVPVLLAVFLPLMNFLMRTKLFGRLANVVYGKFEKKSESINSGVGKSSKNNIKSKDINKAIDIGTISKDKSERMNNIGDNDKLNTDKTHSGGFKSIAGLFILVLIPIPLTGVWTGCAIASIMRFKYKTALITILVSNLFASLLVTVLCVVFEPYINIITLAVGIIAIAAVAVLFIKVALHKPKAEMITV